MATTQYIGSRYVPLFADPAEWNNTRAYEPLTIVLHEGNSYTSKQYVPVGIDIANDDYWAETGNYNSQVEQYRKEVANYDARITTTDGTANNALSLAQTNKQDIATLDAQMAGTQDSGLKSEIEKDIEKVAKPTVLVLGDSWTDNNISWVNKIHGCNVFSYAVSGAAYIKADGSISGTFMEQAVKSKDFECDAIIVFGGLNDARVHIETPSAVGTAAYELIQYLRENHANAKIIVGVNTPPNDDTYSRILDYSTYIQQNVQALGCSFINSQSWLKYYNTWNDDRIHPSEMGQNVIAGNMQTVLGGGTPNLVFNLSTTNSDVTNNLSIIGNEHSIVINGYITPTAASGMLFEICYPSTTAILASWASVTTSVVNEDYTTVGAIAFVKGVVYGEFPSDKLNTKFYVDMTIPM